MWPCGLRSFIRTRSLEMGSKCRFGLPDTDMLTCMCATKHWIQTHSFKVAKSYQTSFCRPAKIDLPSSFLLMAWMMRWFGIFFQIVLKLSIHCQSDMKGFTGVTNTCRAALALFSYQLMCEQSEKGTLPHSGISTLCWLKAGLVSPHMRNVILSFYHGLPVESICHIKKINIPGKL